MGHISEKSEKWELKVERDIFIITGEEKELIVNAADARFIKFRDLVINPAYVRSIKLVSSNVLRIEAPYNYEGDLDYSDWFDKHFPKNP